MARRSSRPARTARFHLVVVLIVASSIGTVGGVVALSDTSTRAAGAATRKAKTPRSTTTTGVPTTTTVAPTTTTSLAPTTTTTGVPTTTTVAPTTTTTVAPTTTFDDEFSGAAGSAPNAALWGYDTGGGGWGNNELETYTSSTQNASLDGQGHLVITAIKDLSGHYTSARLQTFASFAQTYGHFEARMALPAGQGLWPAFWILGQNCYQSTPWPQCGEIDAMENLGNDPNVVETHAHGPNLDFGGPHTLAVPATGWHTYALDWSASQVSWSIDGTVVQTMTKAQAGSGWVFDHPFFVILNLAVGGDWPGAPDASTVFPARVLVDDVRVTN